MNIMSKLFGGAAAAPITAIGNIIDNIYDTDTEKMDKQAVLNKIAQQPGLVQAEINKVEASHRSVFVAGWRPAIGWVGALGLAWQYVGHPTASWAVAIWGDPEMMLPVVPDKGLLELVLAMLGMAALRSVDKRGGWTK